MWDLTKRIPMMLLIFFSGFNTNFLKTGKKEIHVLGFPYKS